MTQIKNLTKLILLMFTLMNFGVKAQDVDSDNDGIPDSIEKTHCGVPLYSYQGQTTPGFIINELFFENFGTMNTTNGTTSTNLAGVGTGATTNYNYYNAIYGSVPTSYADGSGYPNSLQDGRYTVFNNIQYISSWANGIWQTRGDHTGGSATPGNGRMLIVNASYAPGEFYRKTLAGVIPYTPINASIWAMNLDTNVSGNNGRNLPNVTVRFVQSGTVVYSYNTGDIPREAAGSSSAWKNFRNPTTFIPTSNAPIDIVLVNNAPGGSGNDLAIDDIIIYQSVCDTDQDGTPDYLDLDSDGDGCFDAIEGSGYITQNQLNPDGSIMGSEDVNGIPAIANGGQGAGSAYDANINACDEEICTKPVAGEPFSWNYPSGTPSPVTRTFTQPATNYGFVLDIYSLDNSFNLNINGTNIATSEIEFQSNGTPAPGINVRFADGDYYETNTSVIWKMTGTATNPLIRVVINPDGTIALFGSKTSGGPLFPLELFNGNSLNTITWNNGGTNTIIATQNVVNVTSISGSGYGLNIVPCACYKPGLTDAGNTYPTKVGITALSRAGAVNADNWPMVRESGWIALEAKTKGFVPNRVAFDTAGNPVGIATTNFVEGMMVYDTTNKCMKIYTLKEGDTAMAWHCMTTQACPD